MRLRTMIAAFMLVSGHSQACDWSGSAVGVQSGGVNTASGSVFNTSDGSARYGVYGDHDIIIDRLVLGAEVGREVEFRRFDLRHTPRGVLMDAVGRLNTHANRDFGAGLADVIVSGVNVETAQTHETGVVYGLGLSMATDDRPPLRGETLRLVSDESTDSGASLENDSFSVRVSFRF